MQKWLVGDVPFYLKFWVKVTALGEIADFRCIFVRSASAVRPSKKVQLTLIGSLSMSPRWTSYVVSKPPQRVAQKRKVSKIWTIRAAITPKRHEIGCPLLLITNRKSHTGFRLISTSMTLNDLERRNSPYFAFSHRIRLLCWPIITL